MSHPKNLVTRAMFAIMVACATLAATGTAFAGSVTYTYDTLGRLKTATYSNGVVIQYVYDAAGNRSTVTVSGA